MSSFFDQWIMWAFILSGSLVCIGCLLPANWLPPIKNDKFAHFIAFSGLTFLAKLNTKTVEGLIIWLIALVIAGLCIEFLQKLVPGRSFCWKDFRANVAGIISAASVCCAFDLFF